MTSRADELLADGEARRAERLYRRAIEIDDENERAYVGLSTALDLLDRHEEALRLLRDAESLVGWTTEIGTRRGVHLSRLGRWDAAAAELERVVGADRTAFAAARYLAIAGLARADWPQAIRGYDLYLTNRPESLAARDPAVRTRLAFALLHAGEHRRARGELDDVLAAAPDSQPARMLLFTALAELGECDRALELYGALEQIVPAAPTLLYDAAVCQFRVGDSRAALATLEAYRAEWSPPPQSLLLAARIHASLGARERAVAAYREAIGAGLDAHAELAALLAARGEHAQVVSLLWPLVEADSRDPAVLSLAAQALAELSDLDRAIVASTRLAEVRPDVDSWLLHGRILNGRGEWTLAEAAYARALEQRPSDDRARAGLRRALERRANAAFRRGDRDSARELLGRALDADPDAAYAAYNLALLELDRGSAARAVALLEPRVRSGRLPSARARLALGRALLLTGDADAAARQLQTVVDSDAARELKRSALAHLAHLAATSSPERALQLVTSARELGLDDDATRAALDRSAARARLALAEAAYRRADLRALHAALRGVAIDALAPTARTRAALLALFSKANKGVRPALRALAAISDEQLAAAGNGALPADQMRHAIALELAVRLARSAADYRAVRTNATALQAASRRGSTAATAALSRWYVRAIDWAADNSSRALARELMRAMPSSLRTPVLEHNALVAAAGRKRGPGRLTAQQTRELEALSGDVPEALINLAVDAQQRGDHRAVAGYLKRLPTARRTPEIAEWIRWKERLYGAP